MTRVRQNDTALPATQRSRAAGRPIAEEERRTIRAMARGGQSVAAIVLKLKAEGHSRSVGVIKGCRDYKLGAAERREAREREAAALAAQRRETVHDYRTQGVRHPDFPGVTLPRVSIQAGCASFPEAWAR